MPVSALAIAVAADADGNFGPFQTYFIGALPLYAQWDTSDDLLNPTRGFRLGGRLSPEISARGGSFTYGRAQLDGSAYQPVGLNTVLAGRVRLGAGGAVVVAATQVPPEGYAGEEAEQPDDR